MPIPLSRRELLCAGAPLAALGRPAPRPVDSEGNPSGLNLTHLRNSVSLACAWLTDVAQMKSDKLTVEKNSHGLQHKHWRGALRGEYRAADRKWDFFCPIWHTGQAIKALVAASRVLEDDSLLDAARISAEFIGAERVSSRKNRNSGLIFAFEDRGDEVNTSAILECVDGLLALAEATGDHKYAGWGFDAAFWVLRNAYLGDGLFRDAFDVKTWSFVAPPWKSDKPGRPLFDDAIFLKAYKATRNPECRRIFLATAERLLGDEDPPGNWIHFPPCNARTGVIHPRQAYWWGYPMLAAFRETGERKYLECARRAGEWYLHAMRTDGGIFRDTTRDFRTASFGQETSGIACAAILWQELWNQTHEDRWMAGVSKALNHCMAMQFNQTQDPNLRGAILEKVLPPNGTDRSPYHLRDLGTIFFVQAATRLLV